MKKSAVLLSLALAALMAGCNTKPKTPDAPLVTTAPAVEPTPNVPPMVTTPVAPESLTAVPTPPATGGEMLPPPPVKKAPSVAPKPAPKAAPKAAAAAPKATGKTTYVVKKGDTLSGIAKAHYGKASAVKKILAANPGMKPNMIRVGQKIVLP